MRRNKSIFRELFGGYIIFAVLFIVQVFLAVLITLSASTGARLEKLNPYCYVNSDGTVNDTAYWEELGGWIECLDSDYRVVNTIGTKRDEIQQYTKEQLFEYLSVEDDVDTNTSASQYRGFLKAVGQEGEVTYYLIKIGRDTLTFTYNYDITPGSTFAISRSGVFFLCIILFFFADSVGIGVFLTKRIKKPLGIIVSGMDRIKNGEKNIRLDFRAQKEFTQIQTDFNQMMDRLEETEREKTELQARQNRMLLELSHDIRTPVATIKSYANVLKDGVAKEEKKEEYYELIEKKADRVSDLVNAMFLALKYDSTEYRLTVRETDVAELLRRVCAEVYEEITENGREFDILIPDEPLIAVADEQEFTRVIENLLYNALKYNISGTKIMIRAEKTPDRICVFVRDDGSAIDEGLRDHLFEAFARGDASRQSTGGTGLGLAIAKKIMEKHGGDLSYNYEDGWNEFKVSLRL